MPGASDVENSAVYAPGTIDENGYRSDYFGLVFVPTKKMTMMSQEYMREATLTTMNLMGLDPSAINWNDMSVVYEMQAADVITGNNISIMTEKLPFANATVEQYVNGLISQGGTYGEMSMSFGEVGQAELLGETYATLEVTTTAMGMSADQTMYIRKVGERVVCITVTMLTDADPDMFLSCFKAE